MIHIFIRQQAGYRHGVFPLIVRLLTSMVLMTYAIAANALPNDISNEDIVWDGDMIGLNAFAKGASKQLCLERSKLTNSKLISLQLDRHRWVSSHVILTIRFKKQYLRTPREWNGLKVKLLANGTVIIDERQRFTLAKQWQAFLKKK